MLRPETNAFRDATPLDGLWRCRAERDGEDVSGWSCGFSGGHAIAIPGSWNEQLAEAGLMNHTGAVWLQREARMPRDAGGRRVSLHFGSADYSADVWIDGRHAGRSGPPKLPFEIDISHLVAPGELFRLVVRVCAELPEHGPMQRVTRVDYERERRPKDEYWPAVRFDFFPFGGLNRSVTLASAPAGGLNALHVRTGWSPGSGGWLELGGDALAGRIAARVGARMLEGELVPGERRSFRVPQAEPWSPGSPALHDLVVSLLDEHGRCIDEVHRRIGFRTIEVQGQSLLLNGQPLTLKGFGKHEDSPVAGRGVNLPFLVKDFQLLKWTGANSVRTSHYPYDETFLDMADAAGVLVISEVFSVNLDFRRTDETDLAAHMESLSALIARDGGRACVVAWSLSNEPGYLGEAEYRERSAPYWKALFAHARALDPTRPATVANVQYAGVDDPAFLESDFLTLNRYFGWYGEPGQLDRAAGRLRDTLNDLSARHGKPIFLGEFGADAVAGLHATTDQMWTEDFQSDFIETYWRIIAAHPACVGGHVWNFADFRTAQHNRRVVLNRKGVFTRERDPKRAAFTLRRLWQAPPGSAQPQGGPPDGPGR